MMNISKKYEVLEQSYDLQTIFMEYKEKANLDINNENLKENFLDFLQEIISDGYIKLGQWDDNFIEFKELIISPKEQVNLIRKKWPVYYNPHVPELDIEGLWWEVECPVGLAEYPNWEKITKDLECEIK
ncbi:DUF596 domain-containing protein [Uruburuella testudinis]|uniref:DUF596 domain-containing protein n=1 Tax=Uruburuella testudinis TaxID=1282863 RepID=A0ABY4DRW7_9NEIS|nr:DUF596 domain-containing protein [Uruburuella testudinis]UOO81465.1 DUF596 domain-containing protein [Uruburuella testudinis]